MWWVDWFHCPLDTCPSLNPSGVAHLPVKWIWRIMTLLAEGETYSLISRSKPLGCVSESERRAISSVTKQATFKNPPVKSQWRRSSLTPGICKGGISAFASISAAGIIKWEALIPSSSQDLWVLYNVFHRCGRLDFIDTSAVGVREVDGAGDGICGQVILMSWAVAEKQGYDIINVLDDVFP